MIPFTKPSMRRRQFLSGLGGVALGLPFLESFKPHQVHAQSNTIKRFGVFFCCNGVNMGQWFPQGDYGALTAAHLQGTTNEALTPYVSKLVFPRGIHMSPRGFGVDGGGGDDHGKGMAHKLTAQFANENWLAMGPSVDQVIAQAINPGSDGARTPPLTLRVGPPGNYRGLDYISYTGPAKAVAAIHNPWNAYADFMNLGGTAETPSEATDRVGRRRESVLDLVREQFQSLKGMPLSQADKDKLDAHLTAVRSLEQTVTDPTLPGGGLSCSDAGLVTQLDKYKGEKVAEQATEYPFIADLQVDIMAIALACDATRVATLQFGSGSGGPIFSWDQISHEFNHHKLSHGKVRDDCFGDSTENGCANVAGYQGMLSEIDAWHQSKFARLLERLEQYTEADGKTALDNSVLLYSNELSDGKAHSYMNLPYILAGGAGGALQQGQHVLLGEGTNFGNAKAPHNKLLNTLVNVMGIESDWFGVPQGEGGESMQGGMYEELLA